MYLRVSEQARAEVLRPLRQTASDATVSDLRYSIGIIVPQDGVPRVGLQIEQGDFVLSTQFDSCADAILIGHKLVETGREVKALMDPSPPQEEPDA